MISVMLSMIVYDNMHDPCDDAASITGHSSLQVDTRHDVTNDQLQTTH